MQPPWVTDHSPEATAARLEMAAEMMQLGIEALWHGLRQRYPDDNEQETRRKVRAVLDEPRFLSDPLAEIRTCSSRFSRSS